MGKNPGFSTTESAANKPYQGKSPQHARRMAGKVGRDKAEDLARPLTFSNQCKADLMGKLLEKWSCVERRGMGILRQQG